MNRIEPARLPTLQNPASKGYQGDEAGEDSGSIRLPGERGLHAVQRDAQQGFGGSGSGVPKDIDSLLWQLSTPAERQQLILAQGGSGQKASSDEASSAGWHQLAGFAMPQATAPYITPAGLDASRPPNGAGGIDPAAGGTQGDSTQAPRKMAADSVVESGGTGSDVGANRVDGEVADPEPMFRGFSLSGLLTRI